MGIKYPRNLWDISRPGNNEELRMKYSAQNGQNETVKHYAYKRTDRP